MPYEIVSKIAGFIGDLPSLFSFVDALPPDVRDTLADERDFWKTRAPAHCDYPPPESCTLSEYTRCRLIGLCGCELCARHPSTRKVVWEHGVRCCTSCLRANTIGENHVAQLGLPTACLAGLPRNKTRYWTTWKKKGTWKTLHFYWRPTIDELTVARFGRPASEIVSAEAKRNADEKAKKVARVADARSTRRSTLDAWLTDAIGDGAADVRNTREYADFANRTCAASLAGFERKLPALVAAVKRERAEDAKRVARLKRAVDEQRERVS